jgi:hypothetical protein
MTLLSRFSRVLFFGWSRPRSRARLNDRSAPRAGARDHRYPLGRRYGLTKPIRSYIASSVGAEASRAFSAPRASIRRSSLSSARSSS